MHIALNGWAGQQELAKQEAKQRRKAMPEKLTKLVEKGMQSPDFAEGYNAAREISDQSRRRSWPGEMTGSANARQDRRVRFWLWAEAIASVVAGVCLAIPALRMTRALIQIKIIDETDVSEQHKLEGLPSAWSKTAKELLGRWGRLNHVLIHVGLIAFVVAALIKLGLVWAGPH